MPRLFIIPSFSNLLKVAAGDGQRLVAASARRRDVIGAVASRAEGARTLPPLFGVIIFVSSFIHLGHRRRVTVDRFPERAIVAGTMEIVARGAD